MGRRLEGWSELPDRSHPCPCGLRIRGRRLHDVRQKPPPAGLCGRPRARAAEHLSCGGLASLTGPRLAGALLPAGRAVLHQSSWVLCSRGAVRSSTWLSVHAPCVAACSCASSPVARGCSPVVPALLSLIPPQSELALAAGSARTGLSAPAAPGEIHHGRTDELQPASKMQCPPSKLFLCVWDSQGLFLAPLELPENWTDTRETLLEGVLFSLKYLGMTLVEQPKGEELSAAAVKRIVATVSIRSCRTLQNSPHHLLSLGMVLKAANLEAKRSVCRLGSVRAVSPTCLEVSRASPQHLALQVEMQAGTGKPFRPALACRQLCCRKLFVCLGSGAA